MRILLNEDDHFAFDRPWNNRLAAISRHASWGSFDAGPGSGGAGARGNYVDGYQNVPVNWAINTPTKRGFLRPAPPCDRRYTSTPSPEGPTAPPRID